MPNASGSVGIISTHRLSQAPPASRLGYRAINSNTPSVKAQVRIVLKSG